VKAPHAPHCQVPTGLQHSLYHQQAATATAASSTDRPPPMSGRPSLGNRKVKSLAEAKPKQAKANLPAAPPTTCTTHTHTLTHTQSSVQGLVCPFLQTWAKSQSQSRSRQPMLPVFYLLWHPTPQPNAPTSTIINSIRSVSYLNNSTTLAFHLKISSPLGSPR
jgi:hypothetical protein